MHYELYLDSLFLINFVMNLYLLLLVNQATHRTATRGRLIGGAFAGAVCYIFPFLCGGPAAVRYGISMLSGMAAMLLIPFRIRSVRALLQVIKQILFYSFLMGGCALFLIKRLPGFGRYLAGTTGVMGMGALCFLLFFYDRERKGQQTQCSTVLHHGGNRIAARALWDSGNSLTEPVSGSPVCVIDRELFTKLWKEEPAYYRVIPYHSIGRSNGILKGYLLEKLSVEWDGMTKCFENVYIAVAPEGISEREGGEIQVLLNPALQAPGKKGLKRAGKRYQNDY